MKKLAAFTAALAVALGANGTAFAWGAAGHQYVGNLAWALLNPAAQAQVTSILALGPGHGLGEAAVWPDCIRSVNGPAGGPFTYTADQYTAQACNTFGNAPAEKARMEDYAKRNWTNCEYAGKKLKCNLAFHFADVNVHLHGDYNRAYYGTSDYDVVQAIKAAIIVLQCKPGQACKAPAPFSIADKKEALFLLAHFVGDVHQPLHVGAVYLDPSYAEGGDNGSPTTGGNALLLAPAKTSDNLHHEWDTIPAAWGVAPSATTIAAACSVPASPASVALLDRPALWAGESVAAARAAYAGMSFTKDTLPNYWDVRFVNHAAYTTSEHSAQQEQLKKAGARLAEVLNAIWPSAQPVKNCAKKA